MKGSAIAKGAIISYISIFLNIIISLVYTPWMIRKIGVSDYGLYSLVGAFLGYFLLDFGLSGTITRFVAKYRAEGREDKVANMLGLTAKIYMVFDAVIFLVLTVLYFFLTDIFGKGLTPEEIEKLKVLYCISGTFSILSFLFKPVSGAMMAYEYFVENKTIDLLVRVGTVLLVVVALLLNGNVYHLVFITGFVGFSAALLRYTVFIKKSKLKIKWNYFEKSELINLFSFSVWVLVIQISQIFRISLIPTILGIFNNTTEIAVFSVGRNLQNMSYTVSVALNGLFLPMVSRLIQSGDRKSVMDLIIRVGRIQLYIVSLILSGFCIFGKSFISLWVGDTCANSYYVFICISFVSILSFTLQICMDVVYAENRVVDIAKRMLFSSLIGLVLSVVVAPRYGAIGCAATTGFALLLTQILNIEYYQKQMGIDMRSIFKRCHLSIVPLITIYAVIVFFISQAFQIHTWSNLILVIVGYTIGFCLIAWFFLASDYEKNLVLGFINKKLDGK